MEKPVTFAQVLRNRQFFLLWLAQLISSFGDWLAILAIFSLVTFRWKGSADDMAWIFVAFIGPMSLLGPVAGVFVDRWNLKRTMIGSDLARAVVVLGLGFAGNLWQICVLMALISLFSAFFLPAQGSLIPLLVKKEELLVANALNGQSIHLTKIIGPAAAGFLVSAFGEPLCFILDSASFVISAALLLSIHMVRPPKESSKGIGGAIADFREGIVFIWTHAALRFVLFASAAAIFAMGAFNALIPLFVRDVLHSESELFGILVSVVGVGTIAGAAVIGKYAQKMSRVKLLTIGIAGMGLGVALLAVSSNGPLAAGMSFFLGFAAAGVFITVQAFTGEEAPRAMLGRVTSAAISICTIGQLVGVAIAGQVAELYGIRNVYYGLAATLLMIAALGHVYARRERIGVPHAPPSAAPDSA